MKDQTFRPNYASDFLFNRFYFDQITFDEFGGYQEEQFGFPPILDKKGNQIGQRDNELRL